MAYTTGIGLGIWVLAAALWPVTAAAQVVFRTLDYTAGDVQARGYLAYDDAITGKRPGVLVVHEWWGLNDYAKARTRQLAEQGYVALAADMYGDGRTTTDPKQAGEWAGKVKGSPALRTRAEAALRTLAGLEQVDPKRLAAIGFCFGGTAALELAYSGADLAGAVAFHAGLTVPNAEDAGRIKAKLLILHGAEDPYTSPETLRSLSTALDQAHVDWQMVQYGGAVHAFTNPAAGNRPETGAAYDETAARRAWAAMQAFFKELFP
jgi:dienelactone hydrolase